MNTLPFSWTQLQERYDIISERLTAGSLDPADRQKLQKELSFLSTLLAKGREIAALEKEQAALLEQQKTVEDPEFTLLLQEELSSIAEKIKIVQVELERILFPADPKDDRSVFIEIRAGTGGQEAALFASDLMRMYLLYAQRKNWKASVISTSHTDLGGFREVILQIEGKGAFAALKHESGVHRVQRVPATETAGRIHTSTATVAVMPEAEDVEVTISPSDLRIDVFRASGAGGQHVNTTDSAVRITHIPTGVVVSCQDERSQHKNKAKALKVLQSRILSAQQEKQAAELSQQRKTLIGSGDRSEKVRTYNYPQNRITDHQVDLTVKNLDMVMEGHLDDIIEALLAKDVAERRQQPLHFSFS